MAGWFDDIGLVENEETTKTPMPVCNHDWVPTGFGFEECCDCFATRDEETK